MNICLEGDVRNIMHRGGQTTVVRRLGNITSNLKDRLRRLRRCRRTALTTGAPIEAYKIAGRRSGGAAFTSGRGARGGRRGEERTGGDEEEGGGEREEEEAGGREGESRRAKEFAVGTEITDGVGREEGGEEAGEEEEEVRAAEETEIEEREVTSE